MQGSLTSNVNRLLVFLMTLDGNQIIIEVFIYMLFTFVGLSIKTYK